MIKVEPTNDMHLIREIMISDEIWDCSVEDGTKKEGFYPSFDNMSVWFLCTVDGKVAGSILAHNDNVTTIKIHPYILSNYRVKSRIIIKEFFKWFLCNAKFASKIIVSIPFSRKVVYNFAKKVGFVDEGINRESYLSGGTLYDQWMLGITRKEIEVILCPE